MEKLNTKVDEDHVDPNKKKEILEKAQDWEPTSLKGDYRKEEASSKGGFALRDKAITSKLRSAGKEILYRIGKQLLSGKFNLVSIAFPIK